jgi:O-antigen/teichoic acid export membrane protein
VLILLGGQVSRVLVQAVYFVVLARVLGATSYGAFAAAVAVSALVSPFSSLGTNTLMVKNVARDSSVVAREWLRAVLFTTLGGSAIAIGLGLLSKFLIPHELPVGAFIMIVTADLIGLRLIEVSAGAWQALGNSKPLAVLPTMTNILRLAVAGGMAYFSTTASLSLWASLYLLATLPFGLVVVAVGFRKFGYSSDRLGFSPAEFREGMLYSVALSSQNAYNDIDKTMLAKIESSSSAGVYSAAYRIIDMAYVPVRTVAAAAYPHFFREGEAGLRSVIKFTRKICPIVLALGATGAVAVALLAPYAPLILGDEYAAAVDIIRLLSPLVILRAVSFLAADALTGSGNQGFRTLSQIGIALVNIGLNFILIPDFGITGAVISTLFCEMLLGLMLWGRIVLFFLIDNRRTKIRSEKNDVYDEFENPR